MSQPPRSEHTSREGSAASAPETTDLYRPLAAAITKPLAPLVTDTALSAALALDTDTYAARLSGKTVLLTDIPGASSTSSLVAGRKQNRGDDAARATVKAQQAVLAGRGRRRHAAVTSPETHIDYASFLSVHYLHVRYMAQLLGLPVATGAGQDGRLPPGVLSEPLQSKLAKADLTGARVAVRAARNTALVGTAGLVVEETAGTLRLVGEDSVVRVVPKPGSQFMLRFPAFAPPSWDDVDFAAFIAATPQIEVDILGAAFAYRSADRAGRKFRPAQRPGSGWGEEYVQAEWSGVLSKVHEGEDLRIVRSKRRKRGKSRRKDPLVGGSLQVF